MELDHRIKGHRYEIEEIEEKLRNRNRTIRERRKEEMIEKMREERGEKDGEKKEKELQHIDIWIS